MTVAFFESRWFWVVFGVLTYTAGLLTAWLVGPFTRLSVRGPLRKSSQG